MTGTVLLFVVIAISVLPLIPAWFYFRKKNIKGVWFLICMGMGFISVIIALLVQFYLPAFPESSLSYIIYFFIRISLVEELSRLVVFIPFFHYAARQKGIDEDAELWGSKSGLIAGLGFAAAESVFYSASNVSIALLRAFSAAPLHGACGARIGNALCCIRERPLRSALLFLTAILIHGMYDFFIADPGLPSILSLFIAVAAFGSSLLSLRQN